ncbi:MAG: FAD-dependent oxidoreductase [Congregibacter sp.]
MANSTSITTTRRRFIGGSAILMAGIGRAGFVASAREADYDVIVIGAGTGGIPTALFAAERGARVLLLDKAPIIGGTLHWSTGQIAGAGTVFQQRLGIEDSADAHYNDCMRINGGTSDPILTRLTVEHAGATINWLAQHGYEVMDGHPVTGIGHDHFSTRRYQQGVKSGVSIIDAFEPSLRRHIDAGRIDLMLESEAIELVQQDSNGAILGVVARTANDEVRDYRGRSTVIATGGCASNPRLFEELHGVPLYAQAAYPTSTGQGLLLGLGAGAWLRGGDKYASLPGFVPREHRYPTTMHAFAPLDPVKRLPWEILVNARGERFVQEDHPSVNHIEHGILKQPGQRHWAIYDQAMLEQSSPIIPEWTRERLAQEHATHAMFHRADTIEQLALSAGLHPRQLARTVTSYNDILQRGDNDPFARKHRPLALAKPPFHAIEMQGWTLVSFAGLAVNERLQVTAQNGQAIPNLYAVGEALGAGSTSGNAYTNGMLVTPAITFGRLLGQSILPVSGKA